MRNNQPLGAVTVFSVWVVVWEKEAFMGGATFKLDIDMISLRYRVKRQTTPPMHLSLSKALGRHLSGAVGLNSRCLMAKTRPTIDQRRTKTCGSALALGFGS
jgi:hypothetical protein